MIKVSGVVYDYPAARALHGIDFSVAQGQVLALVGPNGAGKTTLLRCMAALDTPTHGRIEIAGLDTQEQPREVHEALGYLPDFFGLYDELTVEQSLLYAARSRGVAEGKAQAAARDAAGRVQIDDRLSQKAGALSRGLRQRLAIAQTIVHRPRVLLLDEPAAGLDPEARRSLSDLILRLASEGLTLVVSSHILAELEDYSNSMLMIREGRVAGGGVVRAGQAAPAAGDSEDIAVAVAQPVADLAAALRALGAEVVSAGMDEAVVRVAGGPQAEAALLARLVAAGVPIRSFSPRRRTLEQAYLAEAHRTGAPHGFGGREGAR